MQRPMDCRSVGWYTRALDAQEPRARDRAGPAGADVCAGAHRPWRRGVSCAPAQRRHRRGARAR